MAVWQQQQGTLTTKTRWRGATGRGWVGDFTEPLSLSPCPPLSMHISFSDSFFSFSLSHRPSFLYYEIKHIIFLAPTSNSVWFESPFFGYILKLQSSFRFILGDSVSFALLGLNRMVTLLHPPFLHPCHRHPSLFPLCVRSPIPASVNPHFSLPSTLRDEAGLWMGSASLLPPADGPRYCCCCPRPGWVYLGIPHPLIIADWGGTPNPPLFHP